MRKILLISLTLFLTVFLVSCAGHSGSDVNEATESEGCRLDDNTTSDQADDDIIEVVISTDSNGEEVKENNGDDEAHKNGTEETNWLGEWQREDGGRFYQSTLVIFDQREDGFYFHFDAYNGGNMGSIEGIASLINNQKAFYADKETSAELTFQLNAGEIEVTANEIADGQAGSGVYFGGKYCRDYIPEPFTLLSSGMVETEEAERAFSDLVGEDLELFLNTAQICIEEDDLDGYGASVLHWFVNGIASYNTSIIMLLPNGKTCAAVKDPDENVVRVYTDADNIKSVPKTIKNWNEDSWETVFINRH